MPRSPSATVYISSPAELSLLSAPESMKRAEDIFPAVSRGGVQLAGLYFGFAELRALELAASYSREEGDVPVLGGDGADDGDFTSVQE